MDFLDFFLLIDKQKHIVVSLLLLIMIFLIRFLLKLHKSYFERFSYAIRDTFLIGMMKEGIDLFWFWNPQITDLLADSIGIFLPLYAFFLIKNLNAVKWHDFYKHEADLARYTFHNLYKVYQDLKYFMKHKFKKYILKNEKVSSKILKDEMYTLKNDCTNFKKSMRYFFLMQCIWVIDFLKFIFKLPIITLFWTFWLIFSPIYIYSNYWQNNKNI